MTISKQFPFETIILATDLSKGSFSILRYTQTIARLHGARLVVVHVIDPIGYAFPAGIPSSLSANEMARQEITRIEEDVSRQGITIHSVIKTGDVCESILQTVRDYDGKLLVLGTRGRTEAGRVALGTIARQLLAKATCPVLTVMPEVESLLHWSGRWRRVLVATDFSVPSLPALTFAHQIAHQQLIVFHSLPPQRIGEREICLERLRFLEPFNESHTVPIDHLVTSGEPGLVIAAAARSGRADLVVLGSPSRVLSEDDFLCSTVLQVISGVSCPVLCMPAVHDHAENSRKANAWLNRPRSNIAEEVG